MNDRLSNIIWSTRRTLPCSRTLGHRCNIACLSFLCSAIGVIYHDCVSAIGRGSPLRHVIINVSSSYHVYLGKQSRLAPAPCHANVHLPLLQYATSRRTCNRLQQPTLSFLFFDFCTKAPTHFIRVHSIALRLFLFGFSQLHDCSTNGCSQRAPATACQTRNPPNQTCSRIHSIHDARDPRTDTTRAHLHMESFLLAEVSAVSLVSL